MPTIDQMTDNVLIGLGDPRSQSPSLLTVLNEVMRQTRTIKRHKHNTGNTWDYNEVVVETTPGESVYQIVSADFGTPLAVISYAPDLVTWIPRLIPMFTPQNMPLDWGIPNNLAAWGYLPGDGSFCTAQRCAFYWRNNAAYIELQPVPQWGASYQIKYLQNSAATYTDALTTSPEWIEDADLIECRTKLAVLPLTDWESPTTPEGRSINAERRRDLTISLSAVERELTRQFEAAALAYSGPALHRRWNPCVG